MNLIPNWKQSWKFWSVRFGILGTVLASIALAAPEAVLYAWAALPEDIKSHMPPAVIKWMGIGIMSLSVISRLIKQPKLEAPNEPDRDREQDN